MATVEHGEHGLEIPSTATPPPSRGAKINPGILTMVFFIGSEVMLFGSFFTAYFFTRYNVADQWPPLNQNGEPFELPKLITGVNTAILVASSFTLHWGEHRLKHYNDRKGLERGLWVTPDAGRDVPDHPDQRVHPPGLHAAGHRVRLDLLHRSPARTASTCFVGLTILTLCLHPREAGTRLLAHVGHAARRGQPLLALRSTSSGSCSSGSSTSYERRPVSGAPAAPRPPSPSAGGS